MREIEYESQLPEKQCIQNTDQKISTENFIISKVEILTRFCWVYSYTVYTLSEHFFWYLLYLFFSLIIYFLSSAAVAYPLRGFMHCVLRAALLHTTVVMCAYLHYCHLPVTFDQSGPSPLTSFTTNAFLPAELLLTGCFFLHHSLQTLETVVHENPRRSAVSEILKPPCLAPTIIPWSKSLRSHVSSPFWWLMWTCAEAPDPYWYDCTHCTAATQLDDEIITWISRWTNKVVSEFIYILKYKNNGVLYYFLLDFHKRFSALSRAYYTIYLLSFCFLIKIKSFKQSPNVSFSDVL